MTDNSKTPENQEKTKVNRRSFMSGTLGVAAGIGAATLMGAAATAQAQPPGGPPGGGGAPASRGPSTFGVESDIYDCEVEGAIPSDLEGAFYRVGPDAQYPLAAGNIPFDGEGHVSMFRFKDGRVHYKTRYVKNERWVAQNEAGRILFPMYRNPSMDDPSVAGLSRSTANTHIINHRNLLLCLKEDSPPSALDLLTLETVDPVYRFDDQLNSKTFTAHPKIDSESGNIVAFGYEADGHGTRTATAFEITGDGRKVWEASVQCPYVGMLHDFAVTQNYIVLYQIPMIMDQAQMDRGGIHWSWDDSMPTYFGYFRRDGDGSDVRWIQGPTRSATHVMGAWDDGDKVYVDVEMSESNPFPFMPMKDDAPWNPAKGTSRIHRLSADLGPSTPRDYSIEKLSEWTGALPRQDDRYNTMPYRYGFMGTRNINAAPGEPANGGYVRFDHATGTQQFWDAGAGTGLAECCFAPKSIRSGEGEGYLMGVASRNSEGGRGDLVILDAMHLEDGPVAVVKLPIRATGQVHGWFVPEWQMPVG